MKRLGIAVLAICAVFVGIAIVARVPAIMALVLPGFGFALGTFLFEVVRRKAAAKLASLAHRVEPLDPNVVP